MSTLSEPPPPALPLPALPPTELHPPELHPSELHPSGVADRVLDGLRGGEAFTTLREDDVAARSAALAGVLRGLGEDGVKVVWVSNPLRSPLTVERFFLQAAGPELDVRIERDPVLLSHQLRELETTPRVLVVQQPESMDPELRDLLTAMRPHLTGLRMLFCGGTAFRPLPEPRQNLPAVVPAETAEEASGRARLPVLLLAVLFVLSTAILFADRVAPEPGADQPAPAAVAAPAAVSRAEAAPPPSPAPGPGASPAAPAVGDAAAPGQMTVNIRSLRLEFDEFLSRRAPRYASLTESERDNLFQEFLRSRNIAPR